jgi:hypothetical protein
LHYAIEWEGIKMVLIRVAASVVAATAMLSVALLAARSSSAQNGEPQPAVLAGGTPPRFGDESRKTLRLLQEELVRIAKPLMQVLGSRDQAEGDAACQGLKVDAARAEYLSVQLRREGAELALKEYEERIVKQETASYEADLKLVRADREQAVRAVERAKKRLATLDPLLTNSTAGLATRWQFEAAELSAQLQKRKVGLAVDQARSKLRVLAEYEGPKRARALRSEVEKAVSDELSKKASWEREQTKLKEIQAGGAIPAVRTPGQERILKLLERAIPIEEQWSARLEQIKNGGEPSEVVKKEIMDLTGQLRAIVEEAEAVDRAPAWKRLKSRIHHAVEQERRNLTADN